MRIDLGIGAQDRIGAEHQISARRGPFGFARGAVADVVAVGAGRHPAIGHVGQVHEEIRAQRADIVGEDAMAGAAVVGAKNPHAPDQRGHVLGREAHELRPV